MQITVMDQHVLELIFQRDKGVGDSITEHGEFIRLFSDGCGLIIVIHGFDVVLVVALNSTTIGIGLSV